MGKGATQRSTGVYALFFEACAVQQLNRPDIIYDLLDRRSRSALAQILEARSRREFLGYLLTRVADNGFSNEDALRVLSAVIDFPSVTLQSTSDDVIEILQAVIVTDDTGTHHLVTAEFQLARRSKPPEVIGFDIELVADDDLLSRPAELIPFVQDWWNRLNARGSATPYSGMPRGVVWCGDPQRRGLLDTPSEWKQTLADTSRVLGMSPYFAASASEARSAGHHDDRGIDVVVFFTSDCAAEFAGFFDGEAAHILLDSSNYAFSGVLKEAQFRLVELGLQAFHADDVKEPRVLHPGEVVYHRKISAGSGKKYDLFDDGSDTPCQHGAESFEPNSGDKARKGMARRYKNFEPKMLLFCRKYPNCNVYAVRG